jgi:hypothetical protein
MDRGRPRCVFGHYLSFHSKGGPREKTLRPSPRVTARWPGLSSTGSQATSTRSWKTKRRVRPVGSLPRFGVSRAEFPASTALGAPLSAFVATPQKGCSACCPLPLQILLTRRLPLAPPLRGPLRAPLRPAVPIGGPRWADVNTAARTANLGTRCRLVNRTRVNARGWSQVGRRRSTGG